MNLTDIADIASSAQTPFYLYDMDLLHRTLHAVQSAAAVNDKFKVHYAMKACSERPILKTVREFGLGLDTVSGGEISTGISCGFHPRDIMFAGVGKTDAEIDMAIHAGIGAFNVESLPELEVISQRAGAIGGTARVALRINPEIDAHTHHFITTGLAENKFGINMSSLDHAVDLARMLPNLDLIGLHFHIGSQITITEPFVILCERVNKIMRYLAGRGVKITHVNVGGGLAIDYDNPDSNPIPDFKTYFDTFNKHLDTSAFERVHFELGRAIVGQCGHLITRVLFVKEGDTRIFVIVDAGMTELIRPALYEAVHPIKNVTAQLRDDSVQTVDIVGPVCESSDVFATDFALARPQRGDILAIGCAGAYGQSMSSHYNSRKLNRSVFFQSV